MEEAPENGKESPHFVHANGLIDWLWVYVFNLAVVIRHAIHSFPTQHCIFISVYNIFPQYLTNGRHLEKELSNMECVFWFSLRSLFEKLLVIEKKWIGYYRKCKVSAINQILMKLGFFSPTVVLKIIKYKISWKSFRWEPSCSTRTDGQRYMTKLAVSSRNFA
jgi:hypothetical protein